jgi:hypothetical protein
MKKLTLDLYERIIDAVYAKSLDNLNMLGHVTRDECAKYIGFYAFHNGLYWSEQDGIICGISTAHPQKSEFDWTWRKPNGIWTAHLVWADNTKSHAEVLSNFLESQKQPVRQLWTWRKNRHIELTAKKLERILSYGRRRNYSTSTSSTELQRVNEVDSASAGRNGS